MLKAPYLLLSFYCLLTSCMRYPEKSLLTTADSKKENNKKYGVWKNHLDEKFSPCAPEKAKYVEYVLLHNDALVSDGFSYGYRPKDEVKRTGQGDTLTADSIPSVLHGTFTCYDKKNRMRSILVYNHGRLEYQAGYYKDGSLSMTEDLKNQYHGMPFSGYLTEYKPDGAIKAKGYYAYNEKYDTWAVMLEPLP